MKKVQAINAVFAPLLAAVFLCFAAVGCSYLPLQDPRDVLPEFERTEEIDVEEQKPLSIENALDYLRRNLNATQYGLALLSSGGASRKMYGFSDIRLRMFKHSETTIGRKKVVYIIVTSSDCDHRTVQEQLEGHHENRYRFPTQQDAVRAYSALITLGAVPCSRSRYLPVDPAASSDNETE